MLSVHNAISI